MAAYNYRKKTGEIGNLMYVGSSMQIAHDDEADWAAQLVADERKDWYAATMPAFVKYDRYSPNKMTANGIFLSHGEMMIIRAFTCDDGWVQISDS